MAKNVENVEKIKVKDFSEKSYLEYAMAVILDRALPHIGDGLKPVQRRIVYAMSELKLHYLAKPKKSARTVGDVLGKYHPHGDAACYEAMVLMAQPFAFRYPYINGQGNWGSPDDPKSFAAMRYTEAKLSNFADLVLEELDLGTVDWVPNFDGTLDEPKVLPAQLPTLLLNGTTGIAVGMATDVPPHNLTEVADACIHLLDNPKATLKDICGYIKGPDFPTQAEIITPKADIIKTYESGVGSIRMRAIYVLEEDDIVITALPHMTSGAKIMEQIAAQMQGKKLPQVADLRDESDHENPTRLVIVTKNKKIDVPELMSHLFATTDLERSYRVNLNVIGLDGKPAVKSLIHIISEWLEFRKDIVKKRLSCRLEKVTARLHILDGLMVAYLNIDEVIAIIRNDDNPKAKLMKKFKLSEIQTDAILDLKLRHLAKLEEQKITGEQNELNEERKGLELTLNSEQRLKTLIKKEITQAKKTHGDKRCSPLVAREESKTMSTIVQLPQEDMTVVISAKGWVRAGKGFDVDPLALSYKTGDEFKALALGKNTDNAIFVDSLGRSYALAVHTLPSIRGYGEPLTGKLTPEGNAQFVSVLIGRGEDQYLFVSNAGYGFITDHDNLFTKNRKGKAIVSVPENGILLTPQKITELDKNILAIASSEGKLLLFPVKEAPILPKGKGRKLFGISSSDFANKKLTITAIKVLNPTDDLTIVCGKKTKILTKKDLEHYYGEPGQKGHKLPKGYAAVTELK